MGQMETVPSTGKTPGANQPPPRSDRDREAEGSSSRDTKIDISPPRDDAKNHPNSAGALLDAGVEPDQNETPSDVQEFKPWNPLQALKDIEVGDFYYKRKNYHAALDRYQEALYWKDNDAIANFRLGQTFEKLDQPDEALNHYQAYLKILPQGQFSAEAEKAVARLQGTDTAKEKPKKQQAENPKP